MTMSVLGFCIPCELVQFLVVGDLELLPSRNSRDAIDRKSVATMSYSRDAIDRKSVATIGT